MKISWTAGANLDRVNLFDFVEASNPAAAALMDDRIWQQTQGLSTFPYMGRIGRVRGTRELVINRTPYLAVYTTQNGVILILRLLHGAQRWPDTLPTRM